MKKSYTIKNIHCADCARSLEEVISGTRGVRSAKINFVTERFDLEIDDGLFEETFTKIKKIIRDFSTKVELFEIDSKPKAVTKIKFKLIGLACPNCAKRVTDALEKLKEVISAEINFELGELNLNLIAEPTEQLKGRIKSLIKNIEPKLKVKEQTEKTKKFNSQILIFTLGLILSVPIFLEEYGLISLASWGYYALLFSAVLALGYSTYITAIRMLMRLNINENLLVTISVFGAIIIGECAEGVMVIGLYTLGKILEAKAVNKSRDSIQELLNLSPEFAVVIRDGVEQRVLPREITLGETIIVRPGEKVALDGRVVNGNANVNAQSLTGEAKPRLIKAGQEILSGVVVLDGVLEIKTTKVEAESTTTKIINLIEHASENKSKTETFISRFSKYYTLLVVMLAVTVGVVSGLVLHDFNTGLYRALVFLVISCPCAFAISVPLTYFSGIGNASRKGILIKGSNYLDASARARLVAFDKTGTLTTGEFNVREVEVLEDAYTESEIIFLASLGEQYSIHPLAKSILREVDTETLPKVGGFKEVAGLGITYEYDGTEYFVGRDETNTENDTVTVVKKGNIILGKIHFEDSIKDSSKLATEGLRALGIRTAILSGDNADVAQETAKTINADDAHGGMLPENKYAWIDETRKTLNRNEKLIYVGDGINDAPSLALADVGVSMGINGSGASIEASDVVLVDDDPAKLVELIKTAKFTKKIVLQNIIFASVIKLSCLVLGTFGIAKMFMAVFADVGVTILAVLNSLRALRFGRK